MSFRPLDPPPAVPSTGIFTLPTNLKAVQQQIHQGSPDYLPTADANYHEVRCFFFRILTIESYRVAKHSPQWVLETVAKWEGSGADLRALSFQDLLQLCPFEAGHCALEANQKITSYPDPKYRQKIGYAIANEVKKLREKEAVKARQVAEKMNKERKKTQHGNSSIQEATGVRDQFPYPTLQFPSLPPGVQQQYHTIGPPMNYSDRMGYYTPLPRSEPDLYARSTAEAASYAQLPTTDPAYQSTVTPPTGVGGFSGQTNSINRTGSLGSIQYILNTENQDGTANQQLAQSSPIAPSGASRNPQLEQSGRRSHPLASTESLHGSEHRPRSVARADDYLTQGSPDLSAPRLPEQNWTTPSPLPQPSLQRTFPPGASGLRYDSNTIRPDIINLVNPQDCYNVPEQFPHPQQSISANPPFTPVTPSESSRPPTPRPPSVISEPYEPMTATSPPGSSTISETHNSRLGRARNRRALSRIPPTPSRRGYPPDIRHQPDMRYPPISSTSMSYPRPDIFSSRRVPPGPPSSTSTQPRSIAPTPHEYSRFPQWTGNPVPLLPTISPTDSFLLEQSADVASEESQIPASTESVQSEDIMQGMVRSRSYGERVENVGPSLRFSGTEGRTSSTHLERIHDEEVMGRRKKKEG